MANAHFFLICTGSLLDHFRLCCQLPPDLRIHTFKKVVVEEQT